MSSAYDICLPCQLSTAETVISQAACVTGLRLRSSSEGMIKSYVPVAGTMRKC